MIEGIILAAGRSRRAGVFKPAHLHRGRPLLLHAVDGLLPWCERVLVVAGHRRAEIAALAAGIPRVDVINNPDPDSSMFGSLRIAAAALAPQGDGFFALPADCPLVSPAVYHALREAFTAHDLARPVVPEHGRRGGHPVLLPAAARIAIRDALPRVTLRDLLRDLQAVRVPVDDPAVLMDLDTPDDLAALVQEE